MVSIEYTAPVNEFPPEHFAFDVDLDAMIKDAVNSGEICISPVHSYSPMVDQPSNIGVFAGMIDIFDRDFARECDGLYAGDIG